MNQFDWLFRMAWIGIIFIATLTIITGVGLLVGVPALLWWLL